MHVWYGIVLLLCRGILGTSLNDFRICRRTFSIASHWGIILCISDRKLQVEIQR